MILGIGCDLIEIERITKVFDSERKKARIFTEAELSSVRKPGSGELAGIYAVKESFAKALGTGIRGITFRDIEVLKDNLGKPYINLEKAMPFLSERFGREDIEVQVTISHDRTNALAFVVVEGGRS